MRTYAEIDKLIPKPKTKNDYCQNAHELTPKNTFFSHPRVRKCRDCKRIADRRFNGKRLKKR